MSTENQNRENQNEKVDYQDLFNSLVKENEQKEPMAEKAKSKKADFINLPVLIAEKK